MQRITVITADVIGSRGAGVAPNFLATNLAQISHTHLLLAFSVSRGDELQGIMQGWLAAPELVRVLRMHCRPLELRIGLGLGCYEGVLKSDSWKMNGPAFFRARQALETISEKKEAATRISTGFTGLDSVLNSAWIMLDTVISGWTPGQWEAVNAYERAGTFAAAAKVLGVAPQNVQKRCKAAKWNQVRQAEKGLAQLDQLLQDYNLDLG